MLAARAADPVTWSKLLTRISRSSLARIDWRGFHLHRLTQAIVRDYLSSAQIEAYRAWAEAILVANDPGDPEDLDTWPGWSQLLHHLLIADPARIENPGLRDLACTGSWYLLIHGDAESCCGFANRLYGQWRRHLGDDHIHTLRAAKNLATALASMGRYEAARTLYEDTLTPGRLAARVCRFGHDADVSS